MLMKPKTSTKNLHQLVTSVVSRATLCPESSPHPAHPEAPEVISGSLASVDFKAKNLESRARRQPLSHSCRVSWTAEAGG